MTVFAKAWFFQSPGTDRHKIAEIVRQSLWASGLYSIWLDAGTAEPPFKVHGYHNDKQLELEWKPAVWLRLRTEHSDDALSNHLSWLLGRTPSLRFTDQTGWTVWEWYFQDISDRWREISGNPIYQNPRKFD